MRRFASVARVAALLLASQLTTGCPSVSSHAEPAIEFTAVPQADSGGPATLAPVAGRVKGARPNQRIVLFAKSGAWWVQPFRSRPFTTIERDASWKSSIHLGTEYAALLVDAEYRPPSTVESLPEPGGSIAAVARVTGSGTFVALPPKTVSFGGYDWEIRQQPKERHGRNDYDASNVWVDGDRRLHLRLAQRDGRWTSAEVRMTRSLGYGTYAVDVRDASQLDPAAVFSMYTWDVLAAEQNHRELNVDLSRWGDPRNMNAQYVIQPEYVAANVFRFAMPSGLLTHSFRWEPGQVAFKTLRPAATGHSGTIVAQRQFTSGVPTTGAERPHLVLLYDRSAPNPPARDVEVVVEKFAYLP